MLVLEDTSETTVEINWVCQKKGLRIQLKSECINKYNNKR